MMSTGEEVKIDHEEIEVVMLGAQVKGMIRVKQGIVNPSFRIARMYFTMVALWRR